MFIPQTHIPQLQTLAQDALDIIWAKFVSLYPKLSSYNKPTIKINNRLTATGGRAFCDNSEIELSAQMFFYNQEEYVKQIIPHEVAHIVDYRIYNGWGHGNTWKSVMLAYGIQPDRLHDMVNPLRPQKEKPVIEKQEFINGQRVEYIHKHKGIGPVRHIGTVTRCNEKTISVLADDGVKWRIPYECTTLKKI